ncbi:hypothetical protein CFP56_022262, partial [Quercus suber]
MRYWFEDFVELSSYTWKIAKPLNSKKTTCNFNNRNTINLACNCSESCITASTQCHIIFCSYQLTKIEATRVKLDPVKFKGQSAKVAR